MAEIEISVFVQSRLSRPVSDLLTLRRWVSDLETERNATHATIRWQFTTSMRG